MDATIVSAGVINSYSGVKFQSKETPQKEEKSIEHQSTSNPNPQSEFAYQKISPNAVERIRAEEAEKDTASLNNVPPENQQAISTYETVSHTDKQSDLARYQLVGVDTFA